LSHVGQVLPNNTGPSSFSLSTPSMKNFFSLIDNARIVRSGLCWYALLNDVHYRIEMTGRCQGTGRPGPHRPPA
jgi:hypothetical protein